MAFALCLVTVGGAAGPAMAHHDDDCRDYSIATAPVDEIALEAVIIAAEFAYNLAHAIAEAPEEAASTTPPPAQQVFWTTERIARVATGIAGTILYGTKIALLVLQGINNEADECRADAHWRTTDELLASAIRRDLAATTTPVAMFVLPESSSGYIDAQGVGVKVIVRDAIDRMKATGQCNCSTAEAYYNHAVSKLGAGAYKQAYTYFRQAYVYAFSN